MTKKQKPMRVWVAYTKGEPEMWSELSGVMAIFKRRNAARLYTHFEVRPMLLVPTLPMRGRRNPSAQKRR